MVAFNGVFVWIKYNADSETVSKLCIIVRNSLYILEVLCSKVWSWYRVHSVIFTPVKCHVICQQRPSRFSYMHLKFVVLRSSLFRRYVYLSSTHTICLCYMTNIIISWYFLLDTDPAVLTAVKIVFILMKHFLLVAELTYWGIISMKIIDTYVLHFEQRSPFRFKNYQDVIPHLSGKFHPAHPRPKNKRTFELWD